MDIKVTAYPTTSVVTSNELARLKTYLRVENDDEDDDLKEMYVQAATMFEKLTGRACFTTSRRFAIPCLDSTGVIELPYPALIAVQSVKYYDEDEVEQTLNASYYTVVSSGDVGRVTVHEEGFDVLINLTDILPNPISVNYTSGYGADASYAPLGVRGWLRECVKWMYNVKGRESQDGIPPHLRHMASLWKLGKIY